LEFDVEMAHAAWRAGRNPALEKAAQVALEETQTK